MHRQTFDQHLFSRFPFVLVPAATYDPLALRYLHRCRRDLRHDFRKTLRIAEIEDHERTTEARVMPVTFYEAGNSSLALQVDDVSGVTDVSSDVHGTAHGGYSVADYGQRLCAGISFVHRNDVAIGQHEIRNRLRRILFRRLAAAHQCQCHYSEKRQTHDFSPSKSYCSRLAAI